VNAGFRTGDTRKNTDSAFFRPVTQRGLFQNVPDVFPGIMGMMFMTMAVIMMAMFVLMMVMFMFMFVFVLMFVIVMCVPMFMFVIMMAMFMIVLMIMFVPVMIFTNIHDRAGSRNAVPFIADKIKLPAFKAEFFKLTRQFPGINAQINKGAEGHIT
jgi:hypothetical protein